MWSSRHRVERLLTRYIALLAGLHVRAQDRFDASLVSLSPYA